jgi:pimeloyl-ACP methyl ester carboxylesterase
LLREEGGKTIYGVIPRNGPVREKVIRMFASHPLEEYRRGMLEFGSSVPDLVPALRALDLPVLGLCGADDPYPDKPEVLAGMPRFREAAAIAGAGRFAHWERPREFNTVLREFLRTLP